MKRLLGSLGSLGFERVLFSYFDLMFHLIHTTSSPNQLRLRFIYLNLNFGNRMEALKNYLQNHPQDIKDWLDQFPWDNFDSEITIREDEEESIVIAKKVSLQSNAEITGLLICQEAEIGEGAEILGTMVCDKGILGHESECNYLIARTITLGEDAEIRSAIITESLQTENGAEIDELETLFSTTMDLHDQSLIKKDKKLSADDFRVGISQRFQLVLESAIRYLKQK